MQYAHSLSQPSWTLTNPRVRARGRDRLPGQDVVLEIHTRPELAADRRRDIVRGADERRHPGVDLAELRRVQIRRAPGDEHLRGASERASDRLARLRLRLPGDAARVDHVQLGLSLRNLGVSRPEQRVPRQHRVGL